LRKNRQAWRLATRMHAFNSAIVLDKRVEVLLLPMRDGLSVISKLIVRIKGLDRIQMLEQKNKVILYSIIRPYN
jgi:hypothetical protein